MEPEFADLGNLASFVTNATTLVEATDLTPGGILRAGLASRIWRGGGRVLALQGGFAAFGNGFSEDLASATKHSSVRSLDLNAHEDWLAQVTKEGLCQKLAESMGARLECLGSS